MSLERENATALYRRIAWTLRDEIANDVFEPSGRLPTENEIGSRFQVSRVTVRQALTLLADEGLIERHQGKGTFTAGKRVRHPLDTLRSFHESLKLQGLNAAMRLISAAVEPSPPELEDAFGPRCLRVVRLHLVDQEPVAVGSSLLPLALVSYPWEKAGNLPIYSIIREVTGQQVCGADIELKAEPAAPDIAALLKGEAGMPVLMMERRSFCTGGGYADVSVFHARSERYSFVLSHRWG